jgi:hypothetical protein
MSKKKEVHLKKLMASGEEEGQIVDGKLPQVSLLVDVSHIRTPKSSQLCLTGIPI